MSEPEVRPDVRAFLERMKAQPRPAFTAAFLASIRNIPMDGIALLDLPVGELAVMRDVEMPGPGGPLRLRLFDARAARAPGPVLVFYHGGGFVVGAIETHAGLAAEMARALDVPVISVDYRLAPENPWPAAPDDAEAAARWIAEEGGAAFGRTFTGLILSGDSAGGNLTLVTAQALRDRPAALPLIFQFPIYPGADHSRRHPSRIALADGYGLDAGDTALYDEHYAGEPTHWRHSPLLGELAGLPPTLLVTAAFDPLRDEGRAYAARLIEAGVTTTYREVAGMIHGFATYRRAIPSAKEDVDGMLALAKVLIAECG